MKRIIIFFVGMLFFGIAFGQSKSVQGILKDNENRIVAGATVTLFSGTDSVSAATNMAGIFSFDKLKTDSFTIRVSTLGFDRFEKKFGFASGQSKLFIPSITLQQNSQMLQEVVVDGVPTVVVKSDTLEYAMRDLKLREGAIAEDALKKLQGVEVDKDGNVTAQGESLKRVRINGKDFFGGDVKTATQNLPANIIEKIQVIDDYGDMANITGNKSGDSEKVLNIQIDPKYNKGQMTTLRAGYGTEKRFQATGMWMGMREGEQISVLGNLNNINAPLFDFNTSGGGPRRMSGGAGGRPGGMFGGSDGLTKIGSIGLNYKKEFSNKLTVYGNYSYEHKNNTTLSDAFNQRILDKIQIDTTSSNNNTIGKSHRLEANLEWKPSAKDYIKITPQFGFDDQNSDGRSYSTYYTDNILNSKRDQTTISNSSAPRYGISGLYNRKLSDKGRNVYVDMNYSNSTSKRDQDLVLERLLNDPNNANASLSSIYERTVAETNNKSWNLGSSVNYSEPLSTHGRLEINYDFNKNKYDNTNIQNGYDRNQNPIDDSSLAYRLNYNYDYDYAFISQKVGASYLFRGDKVTYSLGAAVQPTSLKGNAISGSANEIIDRNNFNVMPIARFEYKFSRQSNISLNYSGRVSEPSVTQILPFETSTNRTSSVVGNADLNPEFNHSMNLRFRSNDFQKGNNFFAMVNASLTNDKIVSFSKNYINYQGDVISETRYLNEANEKPFSLNSYYMFGKSLKQKTYTINFMGGLSFNKNIGYVSTDSASTLGNLNIGRNFVFNQGLMFRYNPSEKFELNPGVRYAYNHTENSFTQRTTNVSSWTPTLIGSANLTPTTVYGFDVSKTFNNGYAISANPFVINTYIEQRFFTGQRGTLRLQAFDLLNQQTNVSRTVSEILISDSRTNRLGRYFMLTFTYKFQKFAMGTPDQGDRFPGGMRPPRM